MLTCVIADKNDIFQQTEMDTKSHGSFIYDPYTMKYVSGKLKYFENI